METQCDHQCKEIGKFTMAGKTTEQNKIKQNNKTY